MLAPTGSGDLKVYPGDATPPALPTMTLPALVRTQIVVVPLSQDAAGEVEALASVAGGGTVHLVVDVVGYFE